MEVNGNRAVFRMMMNGIVLWGHIAPAIHVCIYIY